MTNGATQKTCFVIMGFGEKTDFQTQRVLDSPNGVGVDAVV